MTTIEAPAAEVPIPAVDPVFGDDWAAEDAWVAVTGARVARECSLDEVMDALTDVHVTAGPNSPRFVALNRAAVLISAAPFGPVTEAEFQQSLAARRHEALETAQWLSPASLAFLRDVRDGHADCVRRRYVFPHGLIFEGWREFRAAEIDDAEDLTADGLIDQHGWVTDFGLLVLAEDGDR